MDIIWNNSINFLDLSSKSYPWLENKGSMTQFLKNKNSELTIDVISHKLRTANKSEIQRLNSPKQILERIVYISTVENNIKTYLMYAKSQFNENAIDYFGEELVNLGTNFLGELMNKKYPDLYNYRTDFEFGYLSHDSQLYQDITMKISGNNRNLNIKKKLIIRRSLFKSKNNTILFNLDEIFLPDLIKQV